MDFWQCCNCGFGAKAIAYSRSIEELLIRRQSDKFLLSLDVLLSDGEVRMLWDSTHVVEILSKLLI